jgi:signal transduction histidine kinase
MTEGFRALIDQLPVGIIYCDEQGRLVEWNQVAEGFLSCDAGPRLRETLQRLFGVCVSTASIIQTQFELSGAELLHISMAPDRVPGGFIATLDRQKLERVRTEASVLRAMLKAISSSASRRDAVKKAIGVVRGTMPFRHIAFFEADETGRVLKCTASSGVSDLELARVDAMPVDPAASLLGVAYAHHRPVHVVDLSQAPGPVPFEAERGLSALILPVGVRTVRGVLYSSAVPDVMNEGALRLVHALGDAIGAVMDIAALEAEALRAREIAAQRDRLATIGQLVAGVAHEINNPLAFLKSNLHSLKAEVDEIREQRQVGFQGLGEVDDIVSESIEGVSRIETIVQALKGTARQRSEKVRFDPGRAVTEAVTIFRGAKKSECEIECKLGSLPEVVGSPSALGQVALNLMQNGLDAMSGRERKARKLEVTGSVVDGRVRLCFRDHGTGIPPEVQTRMFDAFYTTKEVGKGTGLGLYICREIAESMGGTISSETSEQGTCFSITVPAVADLADDEDLPTLV